MSTVAEAIGYGVLALLAGLTILALAGLVWGLIDRRIADRRARREALAGLVDLQTGDVLRAPYPTLEPPLGRRARRRKGQ